MAALIIAVIPLIVKGDFQLDTLVLSRKGIFLEGKSWSVSIKAGTKKSAGEA